MASTLSDSALSDSAIPAIRHGSPPAIRRLKHPFVPAAGAPTARGPQNGRRPLPQRRVAAHSLAATTRRRQAGKGALLVLPERFADAAVCGRPAPATARRPRPSCARDHAVTAEAAVARIRCPVRACAPTPRCPLGDDSCHSATVYLRQQSSVRRARKTGVSRAPADKGALHMCVFRAVDHHCSAKGHARFRRSVRAIRAGPLATGAPGRTPCRRTLPVRPASPLASWGASVRSRPAVPARGGSEGPAGRRDRGR